MCAQIRHLAAERGLSLNKLADFAGVGRRYLYQVLAGESDPTLGWIIKVAEALDVELTQLFLDEP